MVSILYPLSYNLLTSFVESPSLFSSLSSHLTQKVYFNEREASKSHVLSKGIKEVGRAPILHFLLTNAQEAEVEVSLYHLSKKNYYASIRYLRVNHKICIKL